MEHISKIGLLAIVPRLSKERAETIWDQLYAVLPSICRWKDGEALDLRVLVLGSRIVEAGEELSAKVVCRHCGFAPECASKLFYS